MLFNPCYKLYVQSLNSILQIRDQTLSYLDLQSINTQWMLRKNKLFAQIFSISK